MFKKYPIEVTIFNVRQGNVYVERDFAVRFWDKKKKTHTMELKNKKQEIFPIGYVHLSVGFKGKPYVLLVSPAPNEYYPVSTKQLLENKTIVPMDENVRNWIIDKTVEANTMFNKPGWLEKFLPLITVAVVGIVAIFFLTVVLDKVLQIMNVQVSSLDKIDNSLNVIERFLNSSYINKQTIITPPLPPIAGG